MKEKLLEMEQYAIDNNVPIIEKKSIAYIMTYIREHNIKNILEIGSAIGYSTILMASSRPDVYVTTIEKDEVRYMECLKNVKAVHLDKKINVVYQDALEVNLSNELKFDLIFIDAAKGQYTKFFEKFKYFLTDKGTIITDNINFHGYVDKDENEIKSKNLRGLVRKIKAYKEYLMNHDKYDTEFVNVGDGIAITQRKKEK